VVKILTRIFDLGSLGVFSTINDIRVIKAKSSQSPQEQVGREQIKLRALRGPFQNCGSDHPASARL
jgi:hypothetical protein